MPATLEQTGPNVVTRRSVFILRFISTVALWSVALLIMFSGYEILFWVLISVFGMIGLWEFYGMLDHKGLPNFKITGNDLRGGDACRQFLLFLQNRTGRLLRFRSRSPAFFSADGIRAANVRTVCGMTSRCRRWLTRCSACSTCFGFTISSPKLCISLRVRAAAQVTGQFYVLYLIAITKFSDMGAYLTGSVIGRHLMVPHISAKKTWEGFFGAHCLCVALQPGHFQTHAGAFIGAELDACDSARAAARVCRSPRRFGRIHY